VRVPVYDPFIEDVDVDAVVSALQQRWLGQGKLVQQFEQAVGQIIGDPQRHVVAVASGTAAIQLSLLAAGVGPEDEVIMSSMNFVGVAQAVLSVGAKPVFCDINDSSLTMDASSIEKGITGKTSAIIALDFSANLCPIDSILTLADEHGIRVIHDAAHSFGSKDQGRPIGSFGDITIFSFDPVKSCTAIDGGVIVVNSRKEERWLKEARSVGQQLDVSTDGANSKMEFREVAHIGFRYHLSNIHAAIGLSQIAKVSSIGESRRQACRHYSQKFQEIADRCCPISTNFEDMVPFIYVVRVKDQQRAALRSFLLNKGIETHVHWQPIHQYKLFESSRRAESLAVTEIVGDEVLTLPLHSQMSEATIDHVSNSVLEYYGN